MRGAEPFRWPVRVAYVDTDRGGVVHHGAYLRYLEQARVELLRARGVDYRALEEEHGHALPVAEAFVKYRRPLTFDDRLEVEIWVGICNRAKVRFDSRVWRGGELTTEARITCACVRLDTHRIVSVHPLLRSALA
ncbi:MAG: acyl-CoA thioesterase [Sandaracinaceae bacterium]